MEIQVRQIDKTFDHDLLIHYIKTQTEESLPVPLTANLVVEITIEDSIKHHKLPENKGKMLVTETPNYQECPNRFKVNLQSGYTLEKKLNILKEFIIKCVESVTAYNEIINDF